MASYDNFSEWFRRKRRPQRGAAFNLDADRIFHILEMMMEEQRKHLDETNMVEHQRVERRGLGDFDSQMHGYRIDIDGKGKVHIKEFGEANDSHGAPSADGEDEPLVDVVEIDNAFHIVAELPGFSEGDIALHCTDDSVEISVNRQFTYRKKISLPKKVQARKVHSTFKNGVLEVVLPTKNQS